MSATDLRRQGLRLAWFIVFWDFAEGLTGVIAGVMANSIALVGFGIDSAIEVFAALVVIWQLRGEGEARTIAALRLIAVSFFLLAGYVGYRAISDLITHAQPEPSLLGIGLSVVATAVMVPVAIMQGRTAIQLKSKVLLAQAKETWLSNYLSISLLIGLSLNGLFGWWWADPVVALLLAAIALREGQEALEEANEEATELASGY